METNEPTSEDLALPLTHEQVLPYARQHLWSTPPGTGRVHVLTAGQRVKRGWYFTYQREYLHPTARPRTYADVTCAGGAAGFIVTDTGKILKVGYSQVDQVLRGEI